jgi:hypothetical protein
MHTFCCAGSVVASMSSLFLSFLLSPPIRSPRPRVTAYAQRSVERRLAARRRHAAAARWRGVRGGLGGGLPSRPRRPGKRGAGTRGSLSNCCGQPCPTLLGCWQRGVCLCVGLGWEGTPPKPPPPAPAIPPPHTHSCACTPYSKCRGEGQLPHKPPPVHVHWTCVRSPAVLRRCSGRRMARSMPDGIAPDDCCRVVTSPGPAACASCAVPLAGDAV